MNKVVVYTALCGPKSRVQKPEWTPPHVDYVCYTDQPAAFVPAPWRVRPMERIAADQNRNAKRYKVLPHLFLPEYDVNIWVDANFRVTRGFDELLPLLGRYDMVLFKHFERDCVYDEAEVCKAMGLDDPQIIDRQMADYRRVGYPAHWGLPECGTIIRSALADTHVFETWWGEIHRGSRRDQLSFMPSVWMEQYRGQVHILDRTSRDGYYHEWTPHISMLPLPNQ